MTNITTGLQPGFQQRFAQSPAEITIGGGAAGVGKSRALLHIGFSLCHTITNVPSIIFRRESKQITIAGGLWDQALKYNQLFPESLRPLIKSSSHEFLFPNGSKLQFSHLSDTHSTHLSFQGSELAFIGFDELTHFTEHQFFYLLGRNRSLSIKMPFIRATCNPQGDGWIKDLISWWLYPSDYKDQALADYPIWERSGRIRFFTKFEDAVIFGNSREEVLSLLPTSAQHEFDIRLIKSLTFIPGRLEENAILERANPNYRASLLALPYNERMQLLYGRWRTVDTEDNILFPRAPLEDLFSNDFVERAQERFITSDIAMEGRDKFVIMVWMGWVLVEVVTIAKSDGASVLNTLENVARQWHVPGRNICFDASGMGGFLQGFMRNSVPFFGGDAPMEEEISKKEYQDKFEVPRYFNLRSQVYYTMAQKLEDNLVFCAYNDANFARQLKEELSATRKSETGTDGKRRIISKDEIKAKIGRSPDYADAFTMRMRFEFSKKVSLPQGRRFVKIR